IARLAGPSRRGVRGDAPGHLTRRVGRRDHRGRAAQTAPADRPDTRLQRRATKAGDGTNSPPTADYPPMNHGPATPARPGTPRRRRRGIGPAATMGLALFAALALAGFVGAGVALSTYLSISADLPDPTALEQIQLPEQSIVYDRTGKVELARFGEFNRDVVTFDEIPKVLVDATTAVEDGSFWDNAGFDTIGIV